MKDVQKFKKVISQLVTEQINTDRCLVKELDDLDNELKKLDSSYKAMINNSFSRVVLDDGANGQKFDVQLYPVRLCQQSNAYIYDMRGYFNGSDRIYKTGVSVNDIIDFIKNQLSDLIGAENSYQRRSLKKGKFVYWNSDEYKYNDGKQVVNEPTDEMTTVKEVKKQRDFAPKDSKQRDSSEIELNLDKLAEKIENAVWGAIKREGESTHTKTAKATHTVSDDETKKDGHTLTTSKLRKAKTKKIQDKSKDVEHSANLTSTPTKFGTPKSIKSLRENKENLEDGLFDRAKASVKGTMSGAKASLAHKASKLASKTQQMAAKASNDAVGYDQATKNSRRLADKERYRGNNKSGKRSIFKTEKERAAAGSLFLGHSKKLTTRFNEFKTDLAKALDIQEVDIVPKFAAMGLTNQSKALTQLANDLQSFNKFSQSQVKK